MTTRLAIAATLNTLEVSVLGRGALAIGAAFALALAVTDVRGKPRSHSSSCCRC